MRLFWIVWCGVINGLPAFAQLPAGHTLLITSLRTGDTEVFAVDPVTGDSRNITRSPTSEDRYPAWSPDGNKIVFTSNRAETDTYQLYLTDETNATTTQLTHLPKGSVVYWPSFTADGKYIFFNEGTTSSVYRVRPDGTGLEYMASGRDANISPDGKQLVCTQQGTRGWGVWTMTIYGEKRKQIIPNESEVGGIAPVWSPDGKQIAFSGQVGEAAEIFVCDADGSRLRQLTSLGLISSSPAFSPDGKFISFRVTTEAYWRDATKRHQAYESKQADKRPVYIMEADGSNARVVESLRYQCAIDGSRAEWRPR